MCVQIVLKHRIFFEMSQGVPASFSQYSKNLGLKTVRFESDSSQTQVKLSQTHVRLKSDSSQIESDSSQTQVRFKSDSKN